MPNFPMIGNQCEMGAESISGGQVTLPGHCEAQSDTERGHRSY